jgi:ribonuclease P protein component
MWSFCFVEKRLLCAAHLRIPKEVLPVQAIPLTRNTDFRRLYKRGRSLIDRNVVIYFSKNKLGVNRVGFTVGKKIGGAVVRNRAKRLMRESFRLLEPRLREGYDFVFVSRSRLPHLHRQAVDASFTRLLGGADLLKKEGST